MKLADRKPEVCTQATYTEQQVPEIDVQIMGDWPHAKLSWNEYVLNSATATSDHLWQWREILSESFGYHPYYLAALQGTKVVGVLPLCLVPRGFGKKDLCSIPFGNYGGILADSKEVSEKLLMFAKSLMHSLRVDSLELRHREPLMNPSLKLKSKHERFFMDLEIEEAKLLKKLGNSNRNLIRKAESLGLRTEVSRDSSELYKIHVDTFKRLGTPCFPQKYFDSILENFGNDAQVNYVYHEGKCIAYDLVIFFRDQIVFQFSGSLSKYFHLKPNQYIFWKKVKLGWRRGAKVLDYCRSRKDSGTAKFKKGMKMQSSSLAYQYLFSKPGTEVSNVSPSNPKYQLMVNLWQKLPLPITKKIGPKVVRYFA